MKKLPLIFMFLFFLFSFSFGQNIMLYKDIKSGITKKEFNSLPEIQRLGLAQIPEYRDTILDKLIPITKIVLNKIVVGIEVVGEQYVPLVNTNNNFLEKALQDALSYTSLIQQKYGEPEIKNDYLNFNNKDNFNEYIIAEWNIDKKKINIYVNNLTNTNGVYGSYASIVIKDMYYYNESKINNSSGSNNF